MTPQLTNKITILNELPGRLRIHNAMLHDPNLDPAYLEAILLNISGVEDVRINIKAACVITHYNKIPGTREKILILMEELPKEIFHTRITALEDPDPVGVIVKGLTAALTPAIPKVVKGPLSSILSVPVLMQGVETFIAEGIKVEVLDAAAVGFSLLRKDYFTANAIVAMLALGQYMEQISEQKSTDLLKSLLRPQVETIWIERNKQEIKVSPDEVCIGDLVVCGTGEMIPIDGKVKSGEASVNQSSISGESVPVHITPGNDVCSGSFVEEGKVKIEAMQVGAETGMAKISRFLENSLRDKSKSQKESDILADKLVPVTFAVGLAEYLLTRDIKRAVSVLTVDYSCAIKLSTPVAVRTAIFTAAHDGVLLKGAEALDRLARVDTLVLDKTGTLTKGVLDVTDVIPLTDLSADKLLSLAAGAEEHYSHPVAAAVIKAASERNLTLPPMGEVDFIVAHGISAYVEGKRVLVGSHHFIAEDEGVDCSKAGSHVNDLRHQGKNLLFVARDGILVGLIAMRDELRPEVPEELKKLKEQGIKKIVVLTGDHHITAKALCDNIEAIDEIHWELAPEDKAKIIKNLQDQGYFIAFAGDGVNDAPALVTADVGICMPQGADLARESAQVVLLEDDFGSLTRAREIAVNAQKTIKNCFKAAVGINTSILLFATAGIIEPVISAMLHNTSTLGILGYAAISGTENKK